MSTTWDMPTPEAFEGMMAALIGGEVQISASRPFRPAKGQNVVVAHFVKQDDTIGAIWFCDLAFIAMSSGRMLGLSKDQVATEAECGELSELTRECGHEIANVGSRLFNDSGSPHLRLSKFACVPMDDLGTLEKGLLRMPKKRADYTISIADYGEGHVSFLAA